MSQELSLYSILNFPDIMLSQKSTDFLLMICWYDTMHILVGPLFSSAGSCLDMDSSDVTITYSFCWKTCLMCCSSSLTLSASHVLPPNTLTKQEVEPSTWFRPPAFIDGRPNLSQVSGRHKWRLSKTAWKAHYSSIKINRRNLQLFVVRFKQPSWCCSAAAKCFLAHA